MFRSPFFIVFTALIVISCNMPEKEKANDSLVKKAVSDGYALQIKGADFEQKGQTDSAFNYYFKAKEKFTFAKDSLRKAHVLLVMANILRKYNDYAEMQALDIEALDVMGRNTYYHATIYADLGISFMNLHEYENAVGKYNKAIEFSATVADSLTMVNNIAYVEISRRNYKKAHDLLLPAVNSTHISDRLETQARIIDNLGYSKFKLDMPNTLPMLERGLFLRDSIGDDFGAITSHMHLASFYRGSDIGKAIFHAKSAQQKATATNSADDRLEALSFLIEHASDPEAKKYAKIYVRVNDSLRTARQEARNYFAALKYDYKKEHEKTLRARAEKAEQENKTLLWIIATIAAITAGFIIVMRIVSRNKKERWKAAYDAEIRISTRLHDELANEVHQSLLIAENRDLNIGEEKEKLLDTLEDIYRKTRSISRENAPVAVGPGFSKRLRELIGHYMSTDCNIITDGLDSVKWDDLDEPKKVAVHRLVQEFLVNMKKHSGCSHALLRFGTSGKMLLLDYSDNGKGAESENLDQKNGLAIMENRILALKGTITFEPQPGKGFRAHVEIPM